MQNNQEYLEWINKAEDNLKWAKDNLDDENYPLVCFLTQQAVELALKGFMYKKEVISPKIHDLVKIYDDCTKIGLEVPEDLKSSLKKLTEYYFESRYPDTLDSDLDNREVAQTALESATKIVDEIKKQI